MGDWVAALPRDKGHVFDAVVRRWECAYAMMSIALDGSLSLRARGELVCARQQVSVAAALFERLAESLVCFCETLTHHGRHIGNVPSVEPLNTEFFRGDTAQSAAFWNSILHHVLFGERSRFFHKLRILSDTLERLDHEFGEAADEISEGLSTKPAACWKTLDFVHYDFNTCLRETEVVLKAFLHTLPAERLASFAADLEAQPAPKRARVRPSLSRVSA